MARMMRHAVLVSEHAHFGKKRACDCCFSMKDRKKHKRIARTRENRAWKKEIH